MPSADTVTSRELGDGRERERLPADVGQQLLDAIYDRKAFRECSATLA